jgi:hypothetical protein
LNLNCRRKEGRTKEGREEGRKERRKNEGREGGRKEGRKEVYLGLKYSAPFHRT